jgi:hypothetical protein
MARNGEDYADSARRARELRRRIIRDVLCAPVEKRGLPKEPSDRQEQSDA